MERVGSSRSPSPRRNNRAWQRVNPRATARPPARLHRRIEKWFAEHDGDGEFACAPANVPYSIVGPIRTTKCIVYTTKPLAAVPLLVDQQDPLRPIAVIGRYGVPRETDVSWIRGLADRRPMYFLGDMDPVDLLVFAWLRARMRPQPLKHLGINESFLSALAIRPTKMVSCCQSPAEIEAMSLVTEVLPDVDVIVGTKLKRWLQQGNKLEIDFLASRGRRTARALRRLLLVESLRRNRKRAE